MLYNILTWVVAGLVLVGLLLLLWYLQPRKLPANPETDGDLRPSSDRARQDASFNRMRFYFFGKNYSVIPRREISEAEKERQAQLGRFDDSDE